jgi:hypothetical protein
MARTSSALGLGVFVAYVSFFTGLVFVIRYFARRRAAAAYGVAPDAVAFHCGCVSWVYGCFLFWPVVCCPIDVDEASLSQRRNGGVLLYSTPVHAHHLPSSSVVQMSPLAGPSSLAGLPGYWRTGMDGQPVWCIGSPPPAQQMGGGGAPYATYVATATDPWMGFTPVDGQPAHAVGQPAAGGTGVAAAGTAQAAAGGAEEAAQHLSSVTVNR